jgi:hypothetical protein
VLRGRRKETLGPLVNANAGLPAAAAGDKQRQIQIVFVLRFLDLRLIHDRDADENRSLILRRSIGCDKPRVITS